MYIRYKASRVSVMSLKGVVRYQSLPGVRQGCKPDVIKRTPEHGVGSWGCAHKRTLRFHHGCMMSRLLRRKISNNIQTKARCPNVFSIF